MSKKNFSDSKGIGALFNEVNELLRNEGAEKKHGRGRPKTSTRVISKSSQEGTKEGDTRATFILKEELLDKLKAIAYWDRVMIKEVINTALSEYVAKYEKKNGEVKPITK